MRFFIDPVTSQVYAYELDAEALIAAAQAAGYIDCHRPPTDSESWDAASLSWITDPVKVEARLLVDAQLDYTAKLAEADAAIDAMYKNLQAADLDDDADQVAAIKAAAKPWTTYRKALITLRAGASWPHVNWPAKPV